MKVSVRLAGNGFARADALVNGIRRRILARIEARLAAHKEARRLRRSLGIVEAPASLSTPPKR